MVRRNKKTVSTATTTINIPKPTKSVTKTIATTTNKTTQNLKNQNFQKFNFQPVGSTKKTKIIHIHNNYGIGRKGRNQTKGFQTPLFGVGHTVNHKRIQTDDFTPPTTAEMATTTETVTTAETVTTVATTPKCTFNQTFIQQPLYKNYKSLHCQLLNDFTFTVCEMTDEMALLDAFEDNKIKFREIVGPNHYTSVDQIYAAFKQVTSFEFYTWTKYLITQSVKLNPKNVDDLFDFKETRNFLKLYFGMDYYNSSVFVNDACLHL